MKSALSDAADARAREMNDRAAKGALLGVHFVIELLGINRDGLLARFIEQQGQEWLRDPKGYEHGSAAPMLQALFEAADHGPKRTTLLPWAGRGMAKKPPTRATQGRTPAKTKKRVKKAVR